MRKKQTRSLAPRFDEEGCDGCLSGYRFDPVIPDLHGPRDEVSEGISLPGCRSVLCHRQITEEGRSLSGYSYAIRRAVTCARLGSELIAFRRVRLPDETPYL